MDESFIVLRIYYSSSPTDVGSYAGPAWNTYERLEDCLRKSFPISELETSNVLLRRAINEIESLAEVIQDLGLRPELSLSWTPSRFEDPIQLSADDMVFLATLGVALFVDIYTES